MSELYFVFITKVVLEVQRRYKGTLNQYQYLGNCPPTSPLTQQQSIDNKLGLILYLLVTVALVCLTLVWRKMESTPVFLKTKWALEAMQVLASLLLASFILDSTL